MSSKKPKFTEPPVDVMRCLVDETDRGCVLVALGYLDGLLQELLREEFRNKSGTISPLVDQLFESGQPPPLQSFYIKLLMAGALQLIDDGCFAALKQLNKLRVHFAHHAGHVTLTEARVDAICDPLHPTLKIYVDNQQKQWARVRHGKSVAHMRFISIVSAIGGILDAATRVAARHNGARGVNLEGDWFEEEVSRIGAGSD